MGGPRVVRGWSADSRGLATIKAHCRRLQKGLEEFFLYANGQTGMVLVPGQSCPWSKML